MKVVHCSRCGGYIQRDELRYIVGVHVTLDTDGFERRDDLFRMAAQVGVAQGPDDSLLDVFARDMAFTLCQACRDHFIENPIDQLAGRPDRGFVQ